MNDGSQFVGKYRGTVVSNVDPLERGRLLVKVSDVLGELPAFWCEPATPMAGVASGMHVTPIVDSGVWVEFEQGNPEYPVYTGFWRGGPEDMPAEALAAVPGVPVIVLATSPDNAISVSDTPGPTGGIILRHGNAFIAVNDLGIQINNGQGAVLLIGPGPTVDINDGALTVLR